MSQQPDFKVVEAKPKQGQYAKVTQIADTAAAEKIIHQLLEEPGVSDVMINDRDHVFLEKNSQMIRVPYTFADDQVIHGLAHQLVTLAGKSDIIGKTFVIDGMLPNGCRLTVVFPPAALSTPAICIRRFRKKTFSLEGMVENGILTQQMHAFLATAVENRANIMIAGNTSSGKTTLLNVLTKCIPNTERLVAIEDTVELNIHQNNVVRMEIDSLATHEEANSITARSLLKSSLRMRPDRIIMGEIRGPEAFEFIQAINTGHSGSMATIHANSPRETLLRLEQMVSIGVDLSSTMIRQQISSSLDLVVQTRRDHDGGRRITHITEVVGMEGGIMITHEHFAYRKDRKGEHNYVWNRANSRKPAVQAAIAAATETQ